MSIHAIWAVVRTVNSRRVLPLLMTGLIAYVWPSSAWNSDGQSEINQTCAISSGCGSGDAPGFPVDITEPGSYVLTSDLDHDPGMHGTTEIIRVLADDVTLDLNGFTVRSTATCNSDACDAGSVDGIDSSIGDRATIRNGRVVGVGGNCIRLQAEARIENVAVSHCALLGISVGSNSIVQDCQITFTGRTGLHSSHLALPPDIRASGTLYRNCTFARNGLREEMTLPDMTSSVSRDLKASGPNFCEDGLCGYGQRRFYLSTERVIGDQVVAQCDRGFHVASAFELINHSGMQYDLARGLVLESQPGMPDISGWVYVGGAHCEHWTTTEGQGGYANFHFDLSEITHVHAGSQSCASDLYTWCVEN